MSVGNGKEQSAIAALIDRQIALLRWRERLREENNDCFLPLFFCESRYLVLMGGGGSGKSIFAGRKVLERVTTERGHRWLVCRKVARTLRQSCFKQLCEQAQAHYADEIDAINKSDMLIRLRNGSEIVFAGLDDVEKLKSIYNITGVWIEEASEILESDFNQLDIRLRGSTEHYKQIIISFNPISVTHWLKRRFFDKNDADATVSKTTYRDNRFLDAEAIRVLEQFRDSDPYYYQVYCLGQWGVTGKTVFDAAAVGAMLARIGEPERSGIFEFATENGVIADFEFAEFDGGAISIYEPPQRGIPYVIGGDTSGDGSDYFVGTVINNVTGRIAAKLRHRADEDMYARQMYCLGKYYNNALIGVETNFSTFPQKELERLGYRNFYVREVADTYTGRTVQAYGFRTTSLTRPLIIAGLVQLVREHADCITDRDTLEEMLTFIRNDHGRAEAESGAHDDCVMAAAIAYYIRDQQRMTAEPEATGRKEWTQDMLEDYRNATREVKDYLRLKWGLPQ